MTQNKKKQKELTLTQNKKKQKEFWNLEYIKDREELQKRNPYGSDIHRKAEKEMKAKCAEIMGDEWVDEYWGEY